MSAPVPSTPVVPGLAVRALTVDDASAVAVLVERIEAADALPTRTTPSAVAEELAYSWNDLAVDSLGVFDGATLRACALVDRLPGSDVRAVRIVLHGGVDPELRRQGVGGLLLDWQLARARQRLAASDSTAVGRIMAGTNDGEGSAGHRALLARAGMSPARYFTIMRRDLTDPIPTVEPRGDVRIVPYADRYDEATRVAHNDAFRDHWGSEEQTAEAWAQGRDGFAPEWSFLAVAGDGEDERVVGYELASRSEEEWPVVGYTFGYTELLGVVRDFRGRRIAPALLARAMERFRADGMEYAALDVDSASPSGADDLYASLGYRRRHSDVVYTIEV
ncbi:GNAT family N-acetyltransferase [Paraoerskovia marina]|uniref:GNAT family N-acetyltransferase n=1 Tax=Paraoerskovia marina TaxID=545619 RepID=UPI001560E308|nr:GNAT family N-acetyltransferase [Paraoerskovia marina]